MAKKKPELVLVEHDVLCTAYDNFNQIFYPDQRGVGLHFWAFLGLSRGPASDHIPAGWMLPSKAANYARMLAGPHCETVAKAMLINGQQHKIPIGS